VADTPSPPPPDVETRLRAQFGDAILAVADSYGEAVVTVSRERFHDLVKFLRDEPEFGFDYCDFSSGVDYGDEGVEIVTQLYSTSLRHRIRVKLRLAHDDLSYPTISDVYATANWHERENMEMFGVSVEGHPQPVKLLLPEPFEGHPLRKDFALTSRSVKPWPGAVEGEEEEEE
jgi:NADH:ubiquinone oxidoreductase subunit C